MPKRDRLAFSTILVLILLSASCVPFKGQAALIKQTLLEVEISSIDWAQVEALGSIQDMKTLLSTISRVFPELRIVVLRRPGRVADDSALWQWQDPRIPRIVNLSYERRNFLSTGDNAVGKYAPPGYESKEFPNRPLRNYPIILLAADTDRTTVFHELLHYLFDRARRAKAVAGRFQTDAEGVSFADRIDSLQSQFDSALRSLMSSNYNDWEAVNRAVDVIGIAFRSNRMRLGEEIAVTQLTSKNRRVLGLSLTSASSEAEYSSECLKMLLATMNSLSGVFVEIGDLIGIEKFKSFASVQRLLADFLETNAVLSGKSAEILSTRLQLREERLHGGGNRCESLFR